jgi:Zinc knuckle
LLESLSKYYIRRLQRGLYAPAKTITANVTAMQAEIKEMKKTLEQDRSKSSKPSSSKADKTCYECGEKGHIKPDCPKLKSTDKATSKKHNGSKSTESKSSSGRKKTHGLSTEKAQKINQLIKEKMKSHPSSVSDDAKLTISMDGQVVAKYCTKCKRYTKGASIHFSSEHKGGTGSDSTEAKPAEVSPSASLAAFEDDAPALLRCEVPDYATPALGFRDFDSDDSSVDSCCGAFLASAGPNPSPSLVDPSLLPFMVYPEWSAWWNHLKEHRGQGL